MSATGDELRGCMPAAEHPAEDRLPASYKIKAELESLPDIDLLALLENDVLDALGVLFVRYRLLVLSISLKTLRDQAEAEDVVQDVFLEISRPRSLIRCVAV